MHYAGRRDLGNGERRGGNALSDGAEVTGSGAVSSGSGGGGPDDLEAVPTDGGTLLAESRSGALDSAGGEEAATDAAVVPNQRPRRSGARRAAPWVAIVAIAAIVAIVLRAFVFQTFFVPSASMVPTLQPGDRMVVLKLGLGNLHRNEIVVFHRPPADTTDPNNEDLVKRVIGLPGETIWSVGNNVYINGKRLAEPYLPKNDPLGAQGIRRQTIPPNDYFVMGDNRDISYDSRYWGYVSRSSVVGEVVFLIWRNGHPYFKSF
ncbi:MAG: signal peptidase I [Acidimicrobiales bacterium]